MSDPDPRPAELPERMGCGWRVTSVGLAAVTIGVPLGSLVAAWFDPRENWWGL